MYFLIAFIDVILSERCFCSALISHTLKTDIPEEVKVMVLHKPFIRKVKVR